MKKDKGKVLIVQGAQWGSEGKGQIAALLAGREADAAVRTGSINAGHTVFYQGKPYKMQQIPTAWVHPDIPLFIGPGAFIHPDILEREIFMVSSATGKDIRDRLYIDSRCFLHSPQAEDEAKKANRHFEMGATGKGSSEAVIEKLRSRGNRELAKSLRFENHPLSSCLNIVDVPSLLGDVYDRGGTILLEGTQGSHLDLHLGPHPFVSNRGSNSATWMAEAGLPPSMNVETVFVARTFPIRVAGDSGPMDNEITWPMLWESWNDQSNSGPVVDPVSIKTYQSLMVKIFLKKAATPNAYHGNESKLAREIGWNPHRWPEETRHLFREELSVVPSLAWESLDTLDRLSLEPFIEMTTVTKKPRRIAKFNLHDFVKAVIWNRPSRVFLGFANYLDHSLRFETSIEKVRDNKLVGELCEQIEEYVPICGFSTGPEPEHHLFI